MYTLTEMKLECGSKEVHENLYSANGGNCPSFHTSARWIHQNKDERDTFKDIPPSSGPKSGRNETNSSQILNIFDANNLSKIGSFRVDTLVGLCTISIILHEDLALRRLFAKCLTYKVLKDQKR